MWRSKRHKPDEDAEECNCAPRRRGIPPQDQALELFVHVCDIAQEDLRRHTESLDPLLVQVENVESRLPTQALIDAFRICATLHALLDFLLQYRHFGWEESELADVD